MPTRPFRIYVHEGLKSKPLRELLGFFGRLFGQMGSIPTSYGCLTVTGFEYDQPKLLEYARESIDKKDIVKVTELRNSLRKEKYIDEIDRALGAEIVRSVSAKYPDVIEVAWIEIRFPFKGGQARREAESFCEGVIKKRVVLPIRHKVLLSDADFMEEEEVEYDLDENVRGVIDDITPTADDLSPEEEMPTAEHLTVEGLWDATEDEHKFGKFHILTLIYYLDPETSLGELEKGVDEMIEPIKKYAAKRIIFSHEYQGQFTYV